MKFDYKFERKDFLVFLKASNRKYNYICLVLFTIVYFVACLDLMSTNALQVLTSYLVSILILFTILNIVTILFAKVMAKRNDKVLDFSYGDYIIELTNDKVSLSIKDKIYGFKYEDISRVSKNGKWLVVYPKDNSMMFIFMKKGFKKHSDYEKCINMILKRFHKEVVKELEVKKTKSKEEVVKSRKKSNKKKL